jgi:hypothetical protein
MLVDWSTFSELRVACIGSMKPDAHRFLASLQRLTSSVMGATTDIIWFL